METSFTSEPFGPEFITLLPADWQESLSLISANDLAKARVYLLKIDGEICAGGLVFPEFLPEMNFYAAEADYWFSQGYLYIGYVWVPLEKRHNNYGSLWLDALKKQDPNQLYWLTIEDLKLRQFYEQAGFVFVKTISLPEGEEQLFVLARD